MKLQRDVPLADYTSLKAGGPAEQLLELEAGDSLTDAIKTADRPVWVLGFGTNVLISDKGLPGTVILNKYGGVEINEAGLVRAGSGAAWDDVVQAAINSGLYGLEFTSGIPGGVGAAVAGNIAAYGHKVADSFAEATMLDTSDGSISIWQAGRFGFDYRSSVLRQPDMHHLVILDAAFQLKPAPADELEYESALKTASELNLRADSLENRRKIIIETRRKAGSLLPDIQARPWTAGSFFKNPLVDEAQVQAIISHEESSIKREQLLRQNVIHGGSQKRVSAAHVLLAAGFARGQAWGPVRLHPEHILKIENTGGAAAQDIYNVVQEIINKVKQKLNITLEPEVQFLGEF
ncbi:MAG TPA: UDP-N-acetylmuramate dehydrogenase [Candidatus Saccharimonadales bacterium]|nr:UDP-N-acetylmuramate dehydrogenase [Candidatus Saccharimonadales bacterium]